MRPPVDLLPYPEEMYKQDVGCASLRKTNQSIRYEHRKMERHTPFSSFSAKVDLCDFYMHFLIGKADCRGVRFVWEGRKF